MQIHFKSTYTTGADQQVIEFYAPLERSTYLDFQVLDFFEKRTYEENGKIQTQTIKTKIEYNDQKVTVFTGPSTLEMELNKLVKNVYVNDALHSAIYVFLKAIKPKADGIIFEYDLAMNEKMEQAINFCLDLTFINTAN